MITYNKTEQYLINAELPEKTESYSPVPHKLFIDELKSRIESRGMIISDRRYLSNDKGNVMQGEFTIVSNQDPDMVGSISFTNSYNKQLRASVSGGGIIKVCENGLYLQRSRFSRKHTGNVIEELYQKIESGLNDQEKQFEELIYFKNELKKVQLSKKEYAELLGIMYIDKNIISSTQLNIVKAEIDRPSYDYKASNTAYELLNHITHSLKSATPIQYMKSHIESSNFFVDTFGILRSQEEPVLEIEAEEISETGIVYAHI